MLADISVIIPAYNRAGLIGETLQSLLNQTLPAKEIIVVDDGSTDGTAEAVEREFSFFSKQFSGNSKSNIQHPTFKILRQANAGPGAARNRGLEEATGEFIHFFDSDDIASPNKHEVQLKALLETEADIAYGPWVKGRFVKLTTENTEEEAVLRLGKPNGAAFFNTSTSELIRDSVNSSPVRSESAPAYEFSSFSFRVSGFSAEGPILQAGGVPKGNLVRALLTNWSIVPHACLFRRSILEKAGGFPEDIWVGEDQLLFLRCLLAGAKVFHTPETMVFYRLGNDPGKLTATGAAQKRHARDWARFLVKAKKEIEDQKSKIKKTTKDTNLHERGEMGPRLASQAGASEPESLPSKLADSPASESLTRSASGSASSPATSYPQPPTAPEAPSPATRYSLPVTRTPSAWFGFRLRSYEAWRDLEKFFPAEEDELKNDLQGIWKRNWFSGSRFQFSGFVLRKLGGLKLRLLRYREHSSFRCGKFSAFGGENRVAANQK